MNTDLRLFIAIECPEEVKIGLEKSMVLIRRACEKGTFSRRENFHRGRPLRCEEKSGLPTVRALHLGVD